MKSVCVVIPISDIDDISNYSCTPNVGSNAGWKPHESKEETLEIMKEVFLDKETVWGIELKRYICLLLPI